MVTLTMYLLYAFILNFLLLLLVLRMVQSAFGIQQLIGKLMLFTWVVSFNLFYLVHSSCFFVCHRHHHSLIGTWIVCLWLVFVLRARPYPSMSFVVKKLWYCYLLLQLSYDDIMSKFDIHMRIDSLEIVTSRDSIAFSNSSIRLYFKNFMVV
jgi:hypothetical protein